MTQTNTSAPVASAWLAPVLSFFSRAYYRDVGLRWEGTGILYLFVLLLVLWIPQSLRWSREFEGALSSAISEGWEKVPMLTLSGGKLSFAGSQPWIVENPERRSEVVIIDTTGQIQSLEGYTQGVLITADKLVALNVGNHGSREERTIEFKGLPDFSVDGARLAALGGKVGKWAPIVGYPVFVLFSFFVRLIQILVLALFGYILGTIAKISLPYEAHLRLSAVAITPALVLTTLFCIFGCREPAFWTPVCAVLEVGYLCVGVLACRKGEGAQ